MVKLKLGYLPHSLFYASNERFAGVEVDLHCSLPISVGHVLRRSRVAYRYLHASWVATVVIVS